jgi:photosystem II stability/assembly factor-like uncharacterized protein
MKNITPVLIAFALIVSSWWLTSNETDAEKEMPAPTEIVMEYEDEEEKHRKRDEWFAAMHKSAPDVDPVQMDLRFRLEHQESNSIINRSSGMTESFANGKIMGAWAERGCKVQSGRIMYSDYDQQNDILYSLSAGGTVWKQDPNVDWVPLNDHFRLSSGSMIRLLDINGTQRILVGTSGKYIYYSDDDGATWDTATGLQSIQGWGNIFKTVVDPTINETIYTFAVEWDNANWNAMVSLYESTDGGSSFQRILQRSITNYSAHRRYDLWSARYDSNYVYAAFHDSLFRITQTGPQFEGLIGASPSASRVLITGSVVGQDSVILYAHDGDKVYKSINSGASWTFTSNFMKNAFRNTSFEAGILNPDAVFFGAVDCYRSFNGGLTFPEVNSWTQYYGNPQYYLHADIPSIQSFLDASGNEFQIINTDAALYKSTNYLGSVTNLGLNNLNASRLYDTYTNRNDPGIIFAGTQDQGYQRVTSDNGGVLSFTQEISGDYGHIGSGDNGENIWMNYPGFTIFWENAGYAFASSSTWDFNGANHFWLAPLMVDPLNSYQAYLAGGSISGGGSKIIQLAYNGVINATELPYNFAQANGGNISAMAISPLDYNHWYVLTDEGYFFHSANAGQSWTRQSAFNGPGSHYFYGATIYPSNTVLGEVYIGGSGYSNPGAFFTSNHGTSFTDISNGLPNTLMYEMIGAADDSLIFAATELGPYCYVVDDQQWYSVMGSAPDQVYWSVDYIPSINTIRYGTHGRGIWDFELDVSSTISTQEEDLISLEIYPNPVSDYVWITSNGHKSIEIYNLKGQQVYREEGSSERSKIETGHLTSGVYIVRTTLASGQVENNRIIVR